MPSTFTTLLKLVKSEIGGANNTWGDDIHAFLNALDAIYRDEGGDLVTSGSADAYTIFPAWGDISALADGIHGRVRIHASNTGATTLNYDSLGVADWKKKVNGVATALVRGDLFIGQYARYVYSEADTCFILENPGITDILELHDFVSVASAATTDIGAVASTLVNITGTTNITGFGTARAGTLRIVKFAAALTLVHNEISLILGPSATDITTSAGACGLFVSEGSGNWRLLLGLATGSASVSMATAAEIWAGTSIKAVGVDQMQAALVEQTLTDGATVTVNFAAGINFKLDTIGGNRTLAATIPAAVVGRSGYIRVKQDATGSRTLAITASPFVNVNGVNIVISTAASAEDIIPYTIISTSKVLLGLARAIA